MQRSRISRVIVRDDYAKKNLLCDELNIRN